MISYLKKLFFKEYTPQNRVRGRIHKESNSGNGIKSYSKGYASISAKVTRADGTVEDYGEISRGKL